MSQSEILYHVSQGKYVKEIVTTCCSSPLSYLGLWFEMCVSVCHALMLTLPSRHFVTWPVFIVHLALTANGSTWVACPVWNPTGLTWKWWSSGKGVKRSRISSHWNQIWRHASDNQGWTVLFAVWLTTKRLRLLHSPTILNVKEAAASPWIEWFSHQEPVTTKHCNEYVSDQTG